MRINAALTAMGLALLAQNALAQGAVVSENALSPQVEAAPLDAVDTGAAGILSPKTTGLPLDIWRYSEPSDLIAQIAKARPTVPALKALMQTLMLAEAYSPSGPQAGSLHLATRLDWLLAQGAVDEAAALIAVTGHDSPVLFAKFADLSLLLGTEKSLCSEVAARPALRPDLALQTYCATLQNDWSRAALTLQSAAALGDISARKGNLLALFLGVKPEGAPALIPPVRPTPLEFRLFEAIGEPLPTAPLPLAFSVLDLEGRNGWKAQLEAGERLAHSGSLPANRLLGLYSLQRPSASGGVWDRARAVQRLETAIKAGRGDLIAPAVNSALPQMANAGLMVPFAQMFAPALKAAELPSSAQNSALRLTLMTSAYESATAGKSADADEEAFLLAIARGQSAPPPEGLPHANAVAAAWGDANVPFEIAQMIQDQRLGAAILTGIALFDSGAAGNGGDLTDALITLRSVGLEDVARRAALQLMILDAAQARR